MFLLGIFGKRNFIYDLVLLFFGGYSTFIFCMNCLICQEALEMQDFYYSMRELAEKVDALHAALETHISNLINKDMDDVHSSFQNLKDLSKTLKSFDGTLPGWGFIEFVMYIQFIAIYALFVMNMIINGWVMNINGGSFIAGFHMFVLSHFVMSRNSISIARNLLASWTFWIFNKIKCARSRRGEEKKFL